MIEEEALRAFDDPDYYKALLASAGEPGKRLHSAFQRYVAAQDAAEKTEFRVRVEPPWWETISVLAQRAAAGHLSPSEKYCLRLAVLHPNMLSAEQRELLKAACTGNTENQPVLYVDEWFSAVGRGDMRESGSDESSLPRKNERARLNALLEKAQGKFEGIKGVLRARSKERAGVENRIKKFTEEICAEKREDAAGVSACYSERQKAVLADIQEAAKEALRYDKEMERLLESYKQSSADVDVITAKVRMVSPAADEVNDVDLAAVKSETAVVRQMVKMTVGRQGNSFPVCVSEFLHSTPQTLGTRENAAEILSWIESVDCGIFLRKYKGQYTRVQPYTLLVPSYGDFGWCWEPVDKANKITGRGRLVIPMYTKNLKTALLTAAADYRWQAAKEKASYMWMEEGLTGNYYQWFLSQKVKGDVRLYFIQDYLQWVSRESEGIQKLDKELRGIFWRYLPFAQEIKDRLKDRALAYQELYQKDMNRAQSLYAPK